MESKKVNKLQTQCSAVEIIREIIVVLAFNFCLAAAAWGLEPSFIGKEIPPTPEHCTFKEGGMIGPTDSFGYEVLLCDSQPVLLFEKFIERRGKKAYFRVIDELRIPTLKARAVILDIPLCSSHSHPGESIAAIGTWLNTPDGSLTAQDITNAWWLNTKLERLVPIPTQEVVCEGDLGE
jgi:hypothetical protein